MVFSIICLAPLADLIKYMGKTINSSGGHSSSSSVGVGVVGSTVAPSVYGVQYMPQPAAAQLHIQPMAQGKETVGILAFCLWNGLLNCCCTCGAELLMSSGCLS